MPVHTGMDMFNLRGKTFVIIGGAGLIGGAFSRAVAEAEGNVVVADSNEKKGKAITEDAKKNAAGNVVFENADIADPDSVEALAKRVVKTFGRVDGVVNATYPRTPKYPQSFDSARQKDMLENLSLMLGGNFSTVRAFAPQMKKQKDGSIVFLGSIYGVAAPKFEIYEGTDMVNPPEYAAAKGGTIMLAKYFASLLGPDNIRVNAISPGGVESGQPESFLKAYAKHTRLQPGMLLPEDLTGALLFLFSDASRKMTGQNLIVDGGWTL